LKIKIGGNLKCPFCGNEKDFQTLKEWKFRFYKVKRIQCQNCNGIYSTIMKEKVQKQEKHQNSR